MHLFTLEPHCISIDFLLYLTLHRISYGIAALNGCLIFCL